MDNRYIGVFDSGLGGLTAVREIIRTLPNENIVYFGDTGRVPYGSRGKDTIIKYAKQDVRFLESYDVKMIVIACGTVSTVALPFLEESTALPLIGVVDATAKAAIQATKTGKIGVIGTAGTINSGAYEKALRVLDSSVTAVSKACPLFVPLVENGHTESEVSKLVAEEYLAEIREACVDTLILGCTHYPHLKGIISKVMGSQVQLIDPGVEIAHNLQAVLQEKDMLADYTAKEQYRFFVSDAADGFESLGSQFLQRNICGRVERIEIEKY
ncbi:MAG: glutamate racemase [Clostridia bacterium]|nr:glutamate racemase [Clostridia bacterium]